MAERAVRHVRKFLGQRLRALRKQRGLSQERLGERSQLSGKFIGEVERGQKSISIDSLYGISVALRLPLTTFTDVPPIDGQVPTADAEKVYALLIHHRTPDDLGKAHAILRSLFGEKRER